MLWSSAAREDLLQRVIDDVQSEAANAAEMKAAASGNPLILMQVQLAADLRKLEALYSQHQRGQHRRRDRLKWLEGWMCVLPQQKPTMPQIYVAATPIRILSGKKTKRKSGSSCARIKAC